MPIIADETVTDELSAAHQLDPMISLGVLVTEDYTEGIGDILLPLYFDGEGLLFVNPRSSITDRDAEEYNIGLGYRRLIADRQALVGANVFYDRRETRAGSGFDQVGFGVEYLSHYFDLRANVYLPIDDRKQVAEFPAEEVSISRSSSRSTVEEWGDPYASGNAVLQSYDYVSTIEMRSSRSTTTRHYAQYEVAMRGWDFEAGVRLPLGAVENYIRPKLFAGYYFYNGKYGIDDVDGFRGRLELQLRPAFFIDTTYYSDNELTGGNFTVGAYMSVPFDLGEMVSGRNPFAGIGERWDAGRNSADMTYRLTDMVRRDPQIRSQISEPEEQTDRTTVETVVSTAGSSQEIVSTHAEILANVTFVDGDNEDSSPDGTAENPYTTITDGIENANSPVWVFDSSEPYTESIAVPEGVSLYGNAAIIQGGGGKTWGGGEHPIILGDEVGPVVTILGDNVTVSGFDVRHSRPLIAVPAIDPVQGLDVSYVGIYGSQVDNFRVSNNTMIDGSLSYGIFLSNSGALPGGSINMQGSLLDNRIENTSHDGAKIFGVGGSGVFDLAISGNYSNNQSVGLRVDATSYDSTSILLEDLATDFNYSGMDIRLSSDNGPASITARNLNANNNDWNGIDNLSLETFGDYADAVIWIDNLTAMNNDRKGADNIRSRTHGENANAYATLTNSSFGYSGRQGLDNIETYASGDNSNAQTRLHNVNLSHNTSEGSDTVDSRADGANGHALTHLTDMKLIANDSYGIDYIQSSAHGNNGSATVLVENYLARDNRADGIWRAVANTYADNAPATVELVDINSFDNGGDGINQVRAETYGVGSDSTILMANIVATGNSHGIDSVNAHADLSGDAKIFMSNIEASDNLNRGINQINAHSTRGSALVDLAEITANRNQSYGIDYIQSRSGVWWGAPVITDGSAEIRMTDIEANNNNTGIYEIIAESLNNGHALIDIDNVVANENRWYGIEYVQSLTHRDGANAVVIMSNVEANANINRIGLYTIKAQTGGDDATAYVDLLNITANNNSDTGISHLEAISYGDDSGSIIMAEQIVANFNSGHGIERIYSRAYGADSHAFAYLLGANTNNNAQSGIDQIRARADDGNAYIEISDIISRFNSNYGIRDIHATARGAIYDASIYLKDSTLTDNLAGSRDSTVSEAPDGGGEEVNITNVVE